MRCALGMSVHTGWASCVMAAGSLQEPHVELREDIEILGDADRFVFHAAAKLPIEEARRSVARARELAAVNGKEALVRLIQGREVVACAIVAKLAPMPEPLETVFVAHPRLHLAEGCFYRDILKAAAEACALPVHIVTPKSLDAANAVVRAMAKRVGPPWGKDQRLAVLAAWSVLSRQGSRTDPNVRGAS